MQRHLKPIKLGNSVVDEEGFSDNEPLSPMARMFHEPDSNVYIIVMIGFKSKINPDVFRANLEHSWLKHHRFSSLQVKDEKTEGGLKWVPTKVNLDNHVIVPNLEPKLIDSPDKFVEDYASNLSKSGIKMSSIPMWDLHLLNIKTRDAESVAVLRVHHSLGDGTSLMSLLLASTRRVDDPNELPTIPFVVTNKKVDSKRGQIWPPYLFIKFWLVLSLFWNTFVDVMMFIATALMFIKDTRTPIKGNGSVPRRFVHRSVSWDDVKFVKNAMNTTINDVMLGVTQAGLSRYLNRKYGELCISIGAVSERNNNLPKNIRLRATFFLNLRPSVGIQELANMMKKGSKARWGNQIGYLIFPFTIALRDDPLDYLREAKAAMDRKKASLEANFSYFVSKFFLMFGNKGLMIHVVSYAKKMTFILSVDEDLIPDPHQLCDDLEESLSLIKNAVTAQGLAIN